MITVVDVENGANWKNSPKRGSDKTTQWLDLTPFDPTNQLVSVGYVSKELSKDWGEVEYLCIDHVNEPPTPDVGTMLQATLDNTDVLAGHNIKHDLKWLLECGFEYSGDLYDTMIAEYVLQKGIKKALSLAALAEEWSLPLKKSELISKYLDMGLSFYKIPWAIIREYGIGDVQTTCALFDIQDKRLAEHDHLRPTVRMMNEFIYSLTEMERNGVAIDAEALGVVEKEYEKRLVDLERFLLEGAREVMGDGPINLNSPDFCSRLFYSREVRDKKKWADTFNIGADSRGRPKRPPFMSPAVFNKLVRLGTNVIRIKQGKACTTCGGTGHIERFKKNGEPFKKHPKCTICVGQGIVYVNTGKTGGLRLNPSSAVDTSASGFKANKNTLHKIKDNVKTEWVRDYIDKYLEYNAVSTYLSTFVDGIKRYKQGNILRTNLNQTITSTGRLSSSAPNFQNMPRGNTFPVKKCMVSRFEGGTLIEADYSGLEFRMAGHLSGCPSVRRYIDEGIDPHTFTMDFINNFDPKLPQISRQEAKSDTFKPLYGGSSGSPRQKAYYSGFLREHYGVAAWHERLKTEAIKTKLIRLPTGREYRFAYASRSSTGYVQQTTQIVNFPVQGFATGDVVPVGIIGVRRLFMANELKSKLILTVHDSLYVDVYPGETDIVMECLSRGMLGIDKLFKEFYGIDMTFPLAIEMKIGANAFDMQEIPHNE